MRENIMKNTKTRKTPQHNGSDTAVAEMNGTEQAVLQASPEELISASDSLRNAPLYKERLGRVRLAVWMREDKNGKIGFSIKMSRSYKTENGFAETSSLDQGDLANAIALLTQLQAVLPSALAPQS